MLISAADGNKGEVDDRKICGKKWSAAQRFKEQNFWYHIEGRHYTWCPWPPRSCFQVSQSGYLCCLFDLNIPGQNSYSRRLAAFKKKKM